MAIRTIRHQNVGRGARASQSRQAFKRQRSSFSSEHGHRGHNQAYTPVSGNGYNLREVVNARANYQAVVEQAHARQLQAGGSGPGIGWILLLAAALGCTQSAEVGLSYIHPHSAQEVSVDAAADLAYNGSIGKFGGRVKTGSNNAHSSTPDGYADTETTEWEAAGTLQIKGPFYGLLGLRSIKEDTQGVVQFGPSVIPYSDSAQLTQIMLGIGAELKKGGLVGRVEVEHAATVDGDHGQTRVRVAVGYGW